MDKIIVRGKLLKWNNREISDKVIITKGDEVVIELSPVNSQDIQEGDEVWVRLYVTIDSNGKKLYHNFSEIPENNIIAHFSQPKQICDCDIQPCLIHKPKQEFFEKELRQKIVVILAEDFGYNAKTVKAVNKILSLFPEMAAKPRDMKIQN